MEGTGRYAFRNGDVYEGEFVGGKPTGEGEYVWTREGQLYRGQWADGMQHGGAQMPSSAPRHPRARGDTRAWRRGLALLRRRGYGGRPPLRRRVGAGPAARVGLHHGGRLLRPLRVERREQRPGGFGESRRATTAA